MRFVEFKQPTQQPLAEGARIQHAEDIVFWEGSKGAQRALQSLANLEKGGHTDVTVKWDGSPAVIFGRDEAGNFVLTDKSGFTAKGYDGKSKSPEDLKNMFLNRSGGKNRENPGYVEFANKMAGIFDAYERATPKDFRGYVYGDILFHPGKPYQGADGRISFTPNQTTYSVLGSSDIGRSLVKAKIAVAAHKQFGYFGDKTGEDFDNPEIFASNPELKVFGLTTVSTRSAVSADNLGRIQALAKNQQAINKLLAPVAGMGYLQSEIYTFVNTQSKAKQLDNINTDAFMAFVGKTPAKAAKIAAHSETHPGVMDAMFALVKEIMAAKDEVIRELDAAEGDITATTGGKPGGEGYVAGGSKLVPRDRWTPFRAD
jgi:hypothetical protein